MAANKKPKVSLEKEADILKTILDYLRLKGVFCWRANSGAFPISDSKGKRRYFKAGTHGMADITGILSNGRRLEIEVKGPKGVLSQAQVSFLQKIRDMGGLAIVARSVADVRTHFP